MHIIVLLTAAILATLALAASALSQRRRRRTARQKPASPPTAPWPASGEGHERLYALFRLDAQVHHDGDLVTVHLVGANSGSRRPYWWIGPDDPRPRAPALVALGLLDGATLCIDLSLSPDVITLHGPDLARKKLVRTLADQSWRAGLEVIVVGGVGGNTALLDVSRASSYAELAGRPRHRQEVIFGPPASAVELGAVRPTMSGDGARAVLIVVGASVRSRWSIDVASSAVRAASAVPQSDRGGSSPRLA